MNDLVEKCSLTTKEVEDLIYPSSDKLACCMAVRDVQLAKAIPIIAEEIEKKLEKEFGHKPLMGSKSWQAFWSKIIKGG